jgi:hypothetical protein
MFLWKVVEVHICHLEDEKHGVKSMYVIETIRNQITCYICIETITHGSPCDKL